ncbi:hypothetical protein THIOKS1860025 [Thiocapsa sp. KS1]|nr:hypothetical protein THIOKS1860025 [Thiocapsa sp. KS1]
MIERLGKERLQRPNPSLGVEPKRVAPALKLGEQAPLRALVVPRHIQELTQVDLGPIQFLPGLKAAQRQSVDQGFESGAVPVGRECCQDVIGQLVMSCRRAHPEIAPPKQMYKACPASSVRLPLRSEEDVIDAVTGSPSRQEGRKEASGAIRARPPQWGKHSDGAIVEQATRINHEVARVGSARQQDHQWGQSPIHRQLPSRAVRKQERVFTIAFGAMGDDDERAEPGDVPLLQVMIDRSPTIEDLGDPVRYPIRRLDRFICTEQVQDQDRPSRIDRRQRPGLGRGIALRQKGAEQGFTRLREPLIGALMPDLGQRSTQVQVQAAVLRKFCRDQIAKGLRQAKLQAQPVASVAQLAQGRQSAPSARYAQVEVSRRRCRPPADAPPFGPHPCMPAPGVKRCHSRALLKMRRPRPGPERGASTPTRDRHRHHVRTTRSVGEAAVNHPLPDPGAALGGRSRDRRLRHAAHGRADPAEYSSDRSTRRPAKCVQAATPARDPAHASQRVHARLPQDVA